MGRGKKYQAEQIVNLLRQIEVAVANGKATALACKDAGITEQSYYRRKEFGGLDCCWSAESPHERGGVISRSRYQAA
jgi:hypothetical protein